MSLLDGRCPYTLQQLRSDEQASTFLIREKDDYGEYPNIYAKVYHEGATREPSVIILSDSGTGLNVCKISQHECDSTASLDNKNTKPPRWNIATFLEARLNPGHRAPYIVLTTHCHYDHICGIQHFLDAKVDLTVLSSSNNRAYLTPWRNLQKHSLCQQNGIKAPRYDARFIDDAQRVSFISSDHSERKETSIQVIHTPGHTPDSLSWYDHETHTLCVGDMLYEQESDETRSGSGGRWAREPLQPVIFIHDSNIVNWNASLHRLLDFVRHENRKLGTDELEKPEGYRQNGQGMPVRYTEKNLEEEDWSVIDTVPARRRVVLCASHVTITTDAEFALLDMLAFMFRIQLDQVPKKRVEDFEGIGDVWLWDNTIGAELEGALGTTRVEISQFSVRAPWSVIHPFDTRTNAALEAQPAREYENSDFRSMLRQMTSTSGSQKAVFPAKSKALASISMDFSGSRSKQTPVFAKRL